MSRWGKCFVVVAFLGWLAAPLVLLVLGMESGFPALEKREPAVPPRLAFGALVDPRFYAGVARTFGDRVPLRVEAVALDAWVDLEIFGDSPNPDVLLGEGGWLFDFDSVVGPCRRPTPPRHAVARIRKISRILQASGRRLIFLVAPDKAAIYPEHLGSSAALGRCAGKSRRRLRARLQAAELPGYVDMWQALSSLKARGDELIYWPHDTHWTSAGALEAARLIIDRLDPALWDEDAVSSLAGDSQRGNLTELIGLPARHQATRYGVRRDVRVEARQIGGFRRFTNTGKVARFQPRVLAVVDSFGRIYNGMLSQYLRQSTWVSWRRFATGRLAAIVDEFARAEVVVLEVLEHNLISLFTGILQDLPALLVGRLLAELPVTDLELPPEAPAAGLQELALTLPAVARSADRYLVVDVASSGDDAGSSGLRIAIRSKEGRPWRAVEAIEVASGDGGRLMVAELPWPKLTVKLRAASGGIRSVGVVDLDDGLRRRDRP